MLEIKNEALTYDDILLEPKFSAIKSREDVSLKTRLYRDVYLDIPIISANMDTVTELEMLNAMTILGGLGICHRFLELEKQDAILHKHVFQNNGLVNNYPTIVSVGVKDDDLKRIEFHSKSVGWYDNGQLLDNIGVCIDVAHGHHESVLNMIEKIRANFGDIPIIAGNVCTWQAALMLASAGADAIKVGVGPGAACQTRTVAGVGVPQLTALMEIKSIIDRFEGQGNDRPTIIADGGIKTSGDIVKALTCADTVMIGSLLAGTKEAPGEVVRIDDRLYKMYRGMASEGAMNKIGSRKKAAEGVECLTPYKGSVYDVVNDLTSGIRSGMSYLGCKNIQELHSAQISAVKVTQNGRAESVPHALNKEGNIRNDI